MSAAKHTPAPWWVTDSGVRDAGGYICFTNRATHYPDQDERYECETAERVANGRLIAASPLLYDALETLVDALTTGAGRDFIEAFVRDAKAALEQAAPGWNMLAEPSRQKLRDLANVRAAAPQLLEAARAFVAPFDGVEMVEGSAVALARAAIAKATGSPS